jgi:hypothetical protein
MYTSLRGMASLTHRAILRGYALVKDGVALVFEGNCDDKSRLFIALGEVLQGVESS